MRQFLMVMLVAVATGLMPAMVRADSPNQDAAKQIRDHLRDSGQLTDYKIAVRYLNGTVWLQGHVHDQEQLNKAVALVFATQGVAIKQVIRDELTIDGAKSVSPANAAVAKTNTPQPVARHDGKSMSIGHGRCRRRLRRGTARHRWHISPGRSHQPRPFLLLRGLPRLGCRGRRRRPACRALRCRCMPRAQPWAVWRRCVTTIPRCPPTPGRAIPPIRTTPR